MKRTGKGTLRYQQRYSRVPAGVLSGTSRGTLGYQQRYSRVPAEVFSGTSRGTLRYQQGYSRVLAGVLSGTSRGTLISWHILLRLALLFNLDTQLHGKIACIPEQCVPGSLSPCPFLPPSLPLSLLFPPFLPHSFSLPRVFKECLVLRLCLSPLLSITIIILTAITITFISSSDKCYSGAPCISQWCPTPNQIRAHSCQHHIQS